jgi:hypothetical protein
MKIAYALVFLGLIMSCSSETPPDQLKPEVVDVVSHTAVLSELSDAEYPDNPDVMVRHEKYVSSVMESIEFVENGDKFDLLIYPTNDGDDTVRMNGIAMMEFMPTIPHCAKDDEYMSLISVVNQEWNRNQVKWDGDVLSAVMPNVSTVNGEKITRIDLARNCLNSYLWELFFYADVEGKNKVFYHGWFDFPPSLYKSLFKKRNGRDFEGYAKYMEDWKDPENKPLNLAKIRTVVSSNSEVKFESLNGVMYPLKGERKKKNIEIIYPVNYTKMSDFHTDSALFATFSVPGFYNRKEPRTTELGRFYKLADVTLNKGNCDRDVITEINMRFERKNGEITQFVFAGIDLSALPRLSEAEANSGNQYSMGIGNHPFYEDALSHEELSSKTNHYFGLLLDKDGNWLDSHTIGIDGPLLHLDKNDPNLLHVWLLSFERHALVGHYTIQLDNL